MAKRILLVGRGCRMMVGVVVFRHRASVRAGPVAGGAGVGAISDNPRGCAALNMLR